MKRGTQVKIAGWVGLKEPFLSRILNGEKRPSPRSAARLEVITGIPMRDWLLLPSGELKQRLNVAWCVYSQEQEARV